MDFIIVLNKASSVFWADCRNGSCFVQSSIAPAPLMPVSLPMRKPTINKALPGASSRIPGAAGAADAGAPVATAGPAKALHDPNAPDAVLLNKVKAMNDAALHDCCMLHGNII